MKKIINGQQLINMIYEGIILPTKLYREEDNECYTLIDCFQNNCKYAALDMDINYLYYREKKHGWILLSNNSNLHRLYYYYENILDDEERKYLLSIITPFKNKIRYIKRVSFNGVMEFITISFEEINDAYSGIYLPLFKKDTMYKNMKIDKKYTLKELNLK